MINSNQVITKLPISSISCTCEEASSFHAPSLEGADSHDKIRVASRLLAIQAQLEDIFDTCEPGRLGYLQFSTTDAYVIERICKVVVGQSLASLGDQSFHGGKLSIDLETQIENDEHVTAEQFDAIDWDELKSADYKITADGFLSRAL